MSLKQLVIAVLVSSVPMFWSSLGLALTKDDISPLTVGQVNTLMKERGWPDSNFPYYQTPNGCGSQSTEGAVPDDLGICYFGWACGHHDRCYMTLGRDKSDCDWSFYLNMRHDNCDDWYELLPPFPICLVCEPLAWRYYLSVVALGRSSFDEAQSKQLAYENDVRKLVADSSPPRNISIENLDDHCAYRVSWDTSSAIKCVIERTDTHKEIFTSSTINPKFHHTATIYLPIRDSFIIKCTAECPPYSPIETSTSIDFKCEAPPGGRCSDDDSDGVPNAGDSCPCAPNEWASGMPAPWGGEDADSDGLCLECNPELSEMCATLCQDMVLDSCPGVRNRLTNCNIHAEVATGAEILDDACDPVPCYSATPTYSSVKIWTNGVYAKYNVTPDVLNYKKARMPSNSADYVGYRVCIQDHMEQIYTNCWAANLVNDKLANTAPAQAAETISTPWHRAPIEYFNINDEDTSPTACVSMNDYSRNWIFDETSKYWDVYESDFVWWTHVEESGVIHRGLNLANNYVPVEGPRLVITSDPLIWQEIQNIILRPYCPMCGPQWLRWGEERILTAFEGMGIGLVRDWGVEPYDRIEGYLKEQIYSQQLIASVDPVTDLGIGASMPLAVALQEGETNAVIDFIWEDQAGLYSMQDMRTRENAEKLFKHAASLGLLLPATSPDAPPRKGATALYSSTQGKVYLIGGDAYEKPAQDILIYDLMGRTWSSEKVGIELGKVAAAALDSRSRRIWIVDLLGKDKARLLYGDLDTGSWQEFASSTASDPIPIPRMSVDIEGNLLLACSGKYMLYQVGNPDSDMRIEVEKLDSQPLTRAFWDSLGLGIVIANERKIPSIVRPKAFEPTSVNPDELAATCFGKK